MPIPKKRIIGLAKDQNVSHCLHRGQIFAAAGISSAQYRQVRFFSSPEDVINVLH